MYDINIFGVGFCGVRFWRYGMSEPLAAERAHLQQPTPFLYACKMKMINLLVPGMLQDLKQKKYMKKLSLYSFLMVLSLLTVSNAYAYDLEVDGIYYDLNMDNYTATVTSGTNKYAGDVVIPSKITYKTVDFNVVKIANSAFYSCKDLKSVSIGEGVTSIGSDAFCASTNLVSVSMPSTVKAIGNGAFFQCFALVKADLPEGIEKIEHSTFCDCKKLEEIKIPSTVKRIGSQAFSGCKSVKKIIIPKAVEYIDANGFGGLALEELVVEDGDNVLKVTDWTFYYSSTETFYIGRPVTANMFFERNKTKTLILGPNLKKWYYSYTGTGVTKVISKITDPSQLVPVFDSITYLDAELIVPNGTLELYKADENWKKFLSISEEGTGTAIESVNVGQVTNDKQMFNLGGMRNSGSGKGISIIRENGKVRKVVR